MDSPRIERFTVTPDDAGARLDRFLAARLPELSRTRVQELITEGAVRVNGAPARASHRLHGGEEIEVTVADRPPLAAEAEAIPLDVLYEDDDLVVLNKPAGMAVHLGAGVRGGTVVNALMARYRELSGLSGTLRPGIVHRLDKSTSGALLVARNDAAHRALAEQFRRRAVEKVYVALLHGSMEENAGSIALPVARDLRRRTRMTARRRPGYPAREARTEWRALLRLEGFTLVEARPHTGRTHQLRVHFSAVGCPVVGDTLYGAPRQARAAGTILPVLGRNFLHAARISFEHPRSREQVTVRAPLPAGLRAWLGQLARALGEGPERFDAALREFL